MIYYTDNCFLTLLTQINKSLSTHNISIFLKQILIDLIDLKILEKKTKFCQKRITFTNIKK